MEKSEGLDVKKLTKEEHNLFAPCGIYCGACDLYLGCSREHTREAYRILKGLNLADVGPVFLGLEQEKIDNCLEVMEKWSQGEKCPGCWGGGGNPVCSIRACAQKQDFLTCAECEKMPCHERRDGDNSEQPEAAGWLELITKRYARWNIENLEHARELGYRRFIDEMQEKVKGGLLTSDVISSDRVISEAFKNMEGT